MSTRAVEQVDDWETRPFSDGYAGLHDLADEGFSGIVTAGPTRLCMTKGTVVGVLGGSIEDFEGASGTVHEAPSPALPLLAVMQEGDSEVQAQYYTEETPIREVNGTLSDGNFTGYIELSENVLSGDYYVVYHQGRSMSVAYVGNSKQLLTEDEAFQRANDEVGIYEVIEAGVDVTEIPEPASATTADTDDATAGAAAATADTEPAETAGDGTASTEPAASAGTDTTGDPPADATDDSPDTTDGRTDEPATGTGGSRGADTSAGSEADAGTTRSDRSGGETDRADRGERRDTGRDDRTTDRSRERDRGEGRGRRGDRRGERRDENRAATGKQDQRDSGRRDRAERGASESGGAGTGNRSQRRDEASGRDGTRREPAGGRSGGGAGTRGGASAGGPSRQAAGKAASAGSESGSGVDDLETQSIPSLDPDRTNEPEETTATGPSAGPSAGAVSPSGTDGGSRTGAPEASAPRNTQETPPQGATEERTRDAPPQETGGNDSAAPADAGDADRLEAALDEREAEIDRLEAELDERDGRIDELERELEDVRAERDDLQSRLERMEKRLDDLRAGEGGESIADRRRMSPAEAIDGTNLFVRYGSKGEATLENVPDGSASREEVNENLDLQYHTQFDADDVAVDGEPFDDYLEKTIQYRFVQWVVRVLPYEIRNTGHEGALKDLYGAMPRIDRAELNGVVSVVYEEDGEEQRTQESFDVVLRDRMGNPLAVANMNESRDPASQGMMEGLITAAKRVSESKESLAGAFLVTSSFFAPEAMEAASQATGGGLLSRDKRESFVKLSRKEGFHLCLVEAREAQFNLSVPEI